MPKLKAPFGGKVEWSRGTGPGIVFGLIALWVIMLLVSIAMVVFFVWIIVINAMDIAQVGPNFWNILWIVIAGIFLLGTATTAK